MNMNILAVNIKTYSIFDFLHDGETEEQLLQRANNSKERNIKSWMENYKNYPDNEKFKNYLKEEQETEYKIMTWEEFKEGQKKYLLSDPLEEITEEMWEEIFNILPPLKWCTILGVEMFCMSEMWTGTYTKQYGRCNGKYYCKMVDIADQSTWIHNLLN